MSRDGRSADEDYLHRVLDSVYTFIGVMTTDGVLTYINQSTLQVSGLKAEDVLGKPFTAAPWWSHSSAVRGQIADAVERGRRGETVRFDTTALIGGGRLLAINFALTPMRDEQGGVTHLIPSAVDITERTRTEAALRQSEARFREAFDHAPIGMTITDLQGRFVEVNPAYCRIVGYEEQELLSPEFSFQRLTHPDDVAHNVQEMNRLLAGEIPAFFLEKRYIRKDGRLVWVRVSSSARRDDQGRPFQVVGLVEEITERKQAAEELQRQHNRLELLSDVAGYLLRSENQEEMVRGLFRMLAAPLDLHAYFNFLVDASGETLRLDSYAGIPEKLALRITCLDFGEAICGTVAERREPMVVTHVQDSPDEKLRLIRNYGIRAYACFPLIARGRLLGTLSFATHGRDAYEPDDLALMRTVCHYVALATDRLLLEKELRDNMEQLAGANDLMGEADRRKDEFLAMLAHELRNPLAPIRNAVHVMGLLGALDPRLQRQREVIDRQVTHMVRLVDDLLDVSRITRGKIELKKEPVDLKDVVSRAVETVQPLIASRRHQFEFCMPEEAVSAEVDPVRLAQVVANLLNNAAKYTDEGGQIWLALERVGQEVAITVRDTGAGIAPEILPRIFDIFSQSERSLDRAQGGLGIGLYLVRRLVEMHNGNVHAWSAGLGEGSTFSVRLPLAPAVGAEAPPHASAERAAPSLADSGTARQRILVVDDNVDSATSLAELIELWGHEVRVVHDGMAAEQAALEYRPDTVLLDIGLPILNGYEVARRLRRQPALEGMLLVALTGYGQEEDRRQAREAGFDRHFTKPVNLQDLKSLLTQNRSPARPRT